ncbi:hypothetical protein ACFSO7_01735 [Bacillus sp. CGMCC 1.16607]|uniref:hypothetical protein n=1 Tax=Bacillus sp. CGMCC 1.16607 TaxID=3351842 RepID=UPI00362C7E79
MNINDISNKLNLIKCKLINKKVIIFGCGSVGEMTLSVLESLQLEVAYFVDNNPPNWSTNLNSFPIKNPEVLLLENKSEFFLLVASSFYADIKDQLHGYGLQEELNFEPVIEIVEDNKIVFTNIYKRNDWQDEESVSGTGSNRVQTSKLVEDLPGVFQKFNIHTIVDAPCGDFNWFQHINYPFKNYFGCDIVEELIEGNKKNYSNNNRKFLCLDITKNIVPKVDLIFSRDCLVHLPNQDIFKVLDLFKKSNSRYLLTTTFPSVTKNRNIMVGEWRPINLELEPFNLPSPILLINEGCTEDNGRFADKSLGLWKLEEI